MNAAAIAPAAEVGEALREVLATSRLPWAMSMSSPRYSPFRIEVTRHRIDDLTLVDCDVNASTWTRQRRQIAATDGDYVGVLMVRSGRVVVQAARAETVVAAGEVLVWDSTHPVRFDTVSGVSKRTLVLPQAALDEVSARPWLTSGIALDPGSPATRLLLHYVDALSETVAYLGAPALAAARNAALELLSGAARGAGTITSSIAVSPAVRAAMDRYIDRHLGDDQLTPAAVAAAHGVSLRTAQRAYNATGQTLAEVIRVRRLARARKDLISQAEPISVVASRWGFADNSHFSHAFKAYYGSSPSEYRGVLHIDGPHIEDLAGD